MEKIVSAAEANRKFSQMLSEVRHGCSYIVTSHGKSVAKIVPFCGSNASASYAKSTLLARLKSQPVKRIGQWTRDELYIDKGCGLLGYQKTLFGAIELASNHKFAIWDAIVLSMAAAGDCRLLLSEDLHDGFTWNGVTVTNPFSDSKHTLLKALLEGLEQLNKADDKYQKTVANEQKDLLIQFLKDQFPDMAINNGFVIYA